MGDECLVVAVAGPSGVGKSSVSYELSRRLGVPVLEADDIYHAIQAVTTPEQQPWLHYWETHPDADDLYTDEEIVRLHVEVCRAMSAPLAAVIENHVRTGMPVILEGDYILPELVDRYPNDVRAVYLTDDDRDQYVANFRAREPDAGEQVRRADASVEFGRWLNSECEKFGFEAIPARPWGTVIDRVRAALSGKSGGIRG